MLSLSVLVSLMQKNEFITPVLDLHVPEPYKPDKKPENKYIQRLSYLIVGHLLRKIILSSYSNSINYLPSESCCSL